MRADDLVEIFLGGKAQRLRALGVEAGRPVLHDLPDGLVRAPRGSVLTTSAPAMRRSDSICSPTVTPTPGMVRLRRGPIAAPSMPAACTRKLTAERGLAWVCTTLCGTGRIASWPASGSRMMPEKKLDAALFGLARPHADGRQPDADAVEEAAPRVVGEDQLADQFLRAVGGERRLLEIVIDHIGERRPEHGDRRGVDDARLVTGEPDGIEQRPRPVEIDAVAEVEIGLRLPRHDAGQMEHDIGLRLEQCRCSTGLGEIAGMRRDLDARSRGLRRAARCRAGQAP